MNFKTKILTGAFITASFLTGIITHKDQYQSFINNNIETIIIDQNNEFNIKYLEKPKIILNKEKNINKRGSYDVEKNTITIFIENIKVSGENYLEKIIEKINKNKQLELTREYIPIEHALKHELGHYYMDSYTEVTQKQNYWLGSQVDTINKSDFEINKIRFNIISEGIAETFAYGIKIKYPENKKWPTKLNEFDKNNIYSYGLQLVQPIIFEYKEKAIHHLMYNLPTRSELFNLETYQKRMIKEIKENKKN